MESIIALGQEFTKIFRKNQMPLELFFKFIGGLFVFSLISTLGKGGLGGVKSVLFILLCAALTTVTPPSAFIILCGAACCFYLMFISVETAAVVFLVFFLIFVFYVRVFPKESLIIPIMLCAYFLRVPYAVPILAGIYVGARAVVPVGTAVFLHYNAYMLEEMVKLAPRETFTPMGALDTGVKIYEYVSTALLGDKGWLYTAAVLILAVLAGRLINSAFIDNERQFSIAVSSAVILIGLLAAKFLGGADLSAAGVIISPVVSALIAYIAVNVDFVLDYSRAERVKFQDDNYYYYVKAVPKIDFSDRNKNETSN
ncbi:hypothetical protein NE664_07350 [Anaerotignum faecicola]|nr:hypothetical protein [Anaerotignum faecicola]